MALTADPRDCPNCTRERYCFGHKARTLQMAWGKTRQPKTREFKHPEKGYRIKQTKDEATERGNIVTEHAKGDRQDVTIRPNGLTYGMGRK